MTFFGVARFREHTILTSSLTPNSVVIDAGAHKGEFSLLLMEQFGCSCFLVEANPKLAAELSSSVKGIASAALSCQDGRIKFLIDENLEASQVVSELSDPACKDNYIEVEALSLKTLLQRFSLKNVDLLKLDIEGAEFQLLTSITSDLLASISQITVEFHDFKPEFQNQQLYEKCRDRLVDMGFICCPMSFRTHGDVLFLNTQHFSLSLVERFFIKYVAKWMLKFTQIFKRTIHKIDC